MKIKIVDDKIVLYLYNYFFNTLNISEISHEVKEIFLKLIKYYKMDINGIYEVFVIENKNYGTILEINKKENLLFHKDLIDIKLKILKDIPVYLKCEDYFPFINYKNIYYDKKYFYINILEVINILPLIEWVEICYFKDKDYLKKLIKIK